MSSACPRSQVAKATDPMARRALKRQIRKITDGNSFSNFLHLHFILYQQVYPQIPKRSVNFAYQYDRKQQL